MTSLEKFYYIQNSIPFIVQGHWFSRIYLVNAANHIIIHLIYFVEGSFFLKGQMFSS